MIALVCLRFFSESSETIPNHSSSSSSNSKWPKSRLLWASSSMIGSKRKFNSAFYAFNVCFLLLSWNSNLSSFRCLSKRDWVDNIGKSWARSDCGFMVGHWNMISCRSGTHWRTGDRVEMWNVFVSLLRRARKNAVRPGRDCWNVNSSITFIHSVCASIWTNWNVQIEACAHCRMH